jgi:hypothetical protein
MHLDLTWRAGSQAEDRRGLRSAAGFVVIALGVGALLLVLEFAQDTRVISDPALGDLVRAQSYLNRSYGPGLRVLSESAAVHRDLNQAISLLAAAQHADPIESQGIDALRSDLEALETAQCKGQLITEELDARYRNLQGQIQGLIDARRDAGP